MTDLWSLLHIADWEPSVQLFTTEEALNAAVKDEAEQAAERSGEPLPDKPDDYYEFVRDNGWKVQWFESERHEVEVPIEQAVLGHG